MSNVIDRNIKGISSFPKDQKASSHPNIITPLPSDPGRTEAHSDQQEPPPPFLLSPVEENDMDECQRKKLPII